jgi:hypothetical protein
MGEIVFSKADLSSKCDDKEFYWKFFRAPKTFPINLFIELTCLVCAAPLGTAHQENFSVFSLLEARVSRKSRAEVFTPPSAGLGVYELNARFD